MGTFFSKINSEKHKTDFNSKKSKFEKVEKFREYNCIRLNNNLLHNILTYIEPTTLVEDYLMLNKSLFNKFNLKPFKSEKVFQHLIGGRQNMNDLYCKFDLSQITENSKASHKTILNIEFEIESKDQGWASVNMSSSWVELRIVCRDDENNTILTCDLVRNLVDRDFKNTKIDINKLGKIGRKVIEIIKKENPMLLIYARSMYPGWECYVRKVNARFLFYEIMLD